MVCQWEDKKCAPVVTLQLFSGAANILDTQYVNICNSLLYRLFGELKACGVLIHGCCFCYHFCVPLQHPLTVAWGSATAQW